MIADDPAALVLLGGILLVVSVVLPRFIRRGRRRSAHAQKHWIVPEHPQLFPGIFFKVRPPFRK